VTADGAIEAFRIIPGRTEGEGHLVNVFGGIAKCDVIDEALIKAGREVGFKVPVVVASWKGRMPTRRARC